MCRLWRTPAYNGRESKCPSVNEVLTTFLRSIHLIQYFNRAFDKSNSHGRCIGYHSLSTPSFSEEERLTSLQAELAARHGESSFYESKIKQLEEKYYKYRCTYHVNWTYRMLY